MNSNSENQPAQNNNSSVHLLDLKNNKEYNNEKMAYTKMSIYSSKWIETIKPFLWIIFGLFCFIIIFSSCSIFFIDGLTATQQLRAIIEWRQVVTPIIIGLMSSVVTYLVQKSNNNP